VARLILVADDSPIIQRKVQRILQDEGFEAETVSNGVAAVKKLSTLQPVLVLADVSLPGKDGYEVCEFVKTSPDLLHVPVLLVGSDLEPYDEQRGARVRADGILKKPFTHQELIVMVTKFTGASEAPASPPASAGTLVSELPATPLEPLPGIPLQPSPEPAPTTWLPSLPGPQLEVPPEDMVGGPSEPPPAPTEPFPGFALESSREVEEASSREVEESKSREVEESRSREVESSSSTPSAFPLVSPLLDASSPAPESSLVTTEPIAEPVPEAGPEPALVGPESSRGVGESRSRGVETGWSAPPLDSSTPVPEPSPVIGVPTPEPVLEAATELVLHGAEGSREVEDSSSREGEPSISREVEADSSASSLDPLTFRLLDSSTSQLFHSSMPAAAPGARSEIGPGLVYTIVHKVVTKMAPPVLSPQQVEELVRLLTREITSELDGTS
jgi:CheY-like chemotaxis protein